MCQTLFSVLTCFISFKHQSKYEIDSIITLISLRPKVVNKCQNHNIKIINTPEHLKILQDFFSHYLPLSLTRNSRKTSTSASLTMPKPLTVWITTNWNILKEMGIPDHLTCFPRNLYAGQEATVRIGHGMVGWFKTGKGVC